MKMNKALTRERLAEVLRYSPETGEFEWIANKGMRVCIGKPVGGISDEGYLLIKVDGTKYPAHRLAWLYVHGRWPAGELDHRDRCKTNNRILNLREASDSQNMANRGRQKNNTSGVPGVRWRAKLGTWSATIKHEGRTHYLGCYKSKEQAAQVRRAAEQRLFGSFAPIAEAA